MKKLKIGITCYPTVGGSGVIATELGKLLAEKGHEIHFITSSMPFRLSEMIPTIYYHQVEVNNYAVFQYAPYDIALANKMADVIQKEKLDILHVHYAIPHAVCAVLAKDMAKSNVKIVTTLHGTDITVLGYDSSLTGAIRYGIERSNAVTAVSDSLGQQTMDLIAPEQTIQTIYNFVDERDYKPYRSNEIRAYYKISPDDRVIIHVSNFRRVKRVEDVIQSFAIIRKQEKAKLLLVGDGPEMSYIQSLVKKLELDDDVLFLGRQDNVAELYALSDLKILLSEKEAFGLVLLEAMACGVPCIGSAVGGIPEVIEDGVNGFVVPPYCPEVVAEKVIELFNKPELLEEMKRNAYETVRQKFSSREIVKQYEQIYEEVLANDEH